MLLNSLFKTSSKNLELANNAIALEDWPKTSKHLKAVVKRLGKNTPESTFVKLSRSYRQQNLFEKATHTVNEGLSYYPDSLSINIEGCEVAISNQDWQHAVSLLRSVESKFGEQTPLAVRVRLARGLRHLNKLEEAQTVTQKYLKQFPDNLELLVEETEILTAEKKWASALKSWQTILPKLDPTNLGMKLHVRLNISVIQRLNNIHVYKQKIKNYGLQKQITKPKIAVVTSVTKGYDVIKLHEFIDNRFDYIVYTDAEFESSGLYSVHPLPFTGLDNARNIRYVKTHPHTLPGNYDLVVWLDASLMIVGDLYPLLSKFLKSGQAIGANTHPLRKSIYEEFGACVKAKKENYKIMKRQIDFYKRDGYVDNKLAECNFLAFNLRDKKKEVELAMETWWDQIRKFSRRDQLSFPYSLSKHGLGWYPLTKPPDSIRNHPAFILAAHENDYGILQELYKSMKAK